MIVVICWFVFITASRIALFLSCQWSFYSFLFGFSNSNTASQKKQQHCWLRFIEILIQQVTFHPAFSFSHIEKGDIESYSHTLKLAIVSFSSEKLVSLLPEYVVPYMIHLLAHDPDFTKPHEYEQLKDIKE